MSTPTSIYLIGTLDTDDPSALSEIDPDFGYFASREEADAWAEKENAPHVARYAKRFAAYKAALAEWDEKTEAARALGFANPARPPYPPTAPTLYSVVEVAPSPNAKSASPPDAVPHCDRQTGVSVDHIDLDAGLDMLTRVGYTHANTHQVILYALQRWARGEEASAEKAAIDRSFYGIDLTSWRMVLAAAQRVGAEKAKPAPQPRGKVPADEIPTAGMVLTGSIIVGNYTVLDPDGIRERPNYLPPITPDVTQ